MIFHVLANDRISSFSALLCSDHVPLLSLFAHYELLKSTAGRSSLATAEEATVVPKSSLWPHVQVFGKSNLPHWPSLSLGVSESVHEV